MRINEMKEKERTNEIIINEIEGTGNLLCDFSINFN